MSQIKFPSSYVTKSGFSTGVKGVTGAAPQTVAGNTVYSQFVGEALAARVYAKATTTSLALTAKWQVLDDDNATWIDVVDDTNPSNNALITGTGSAASVTKMVAAPPAVRAGNRSARLVILSSGATGGGLGTDECSIAYDYRAPIVAYGP